MSESIYERLSQYNYKLTSQRQAILDVLEKRKGSHLTAEELYAEVKQYAPNIGMATIYRTLELLSRLEVVHKSSFDEGKYRYELCSEEQHYHHHFVCVQCGSIHELEEDHLQHLEESLEKQGFEVVDHALKLYGYCPECIRKRRQT